MTLMTDPRPLMHLDDGTAIIDHERRTIHHPPVVTVTVPMRALLEEIYTAVMRERQDELDEAARQNPISIVVSQEVPTGRRAIDI